jgi:hypothetical protein
MEINLSEEKVLIQTVLGYSTGIRPSMNYFLEYCARVQDSKAWKKIGGLNFEKELPVIQQWLNRTITAHPPADHIQAFWFGINHPVLNDGVTSCDLYISGSPRFNADDRSAGWAQLANDSYLPEGCYAKSGILDEMYYLVRKFNGAPQGENILSLGYASLVVKSALSLIDKKYLIGKYGPRPIAIGLDKGGFIYLNS